MFDVDLDHDVALAERIAETSEVIRRALKWPQGSATPTLRVGRKTLTLTPPVVAQLVDDLARTMVSFADPTERPRVESASQGAAWNPWSTSSLGDITDADQPEVTDDPEDHMVRCAKLLDALETALELGPGFLEPTEIDTLRALHGAVCERFQDARQPFGSKGETRRSQWCDAAAKIFERYVVQVEPAIATTPSSFAPAIADLLTEVTGDVIDPESVERTIRNQRRNNQTP